MKNNKGFSLVELIVVIAIMAILVGVAVPVYSSYVEKSQKAADIQLVDEIKHALQVAYVADQVEGTATIVLTSNSANGSGDSSVTEEWLNKVMSYTFGSDWMTSLELKYSDWNSNAYTISTHYNNSSYKGNQEKLLSDVQQLTEALETFVTTSGTEFIGTDYTAFAEKYGIDVTNPTEVANAASLFVAEQTKDVNVDEFVKAWTRNDGSSYDDIASGNFATQMGLMAQLAAHYARAESLAAFIDSQYPAVTFTDSLGASCTASQWLSGQTVNGNTPTDVINSINTITTNFVANMGGLRDEILLAYCQSDDAEKDARAYVSMMGAIEENSDEILSRVGQEDTLYTDGVVNQLLNNYMTAGAALKDMPAGSIAVVFSAIDDSYSIMVVGMN